MSQPPQPDPPRDEPGPDALKQQIRAALRRAAFFEAEQLAERWAEARHDPVTWAFERVAEVVMEMAPMDPARAPETHEKAARIYARAYGHALAASDDHGANRMRGVLEHRLSHTAAAVLAGVVSLGTSEAATGQGQLLSYLGNNRLLLDERPELLVTLASVATRRELADGEALCREGEGGQALWLIAQGKLEASVQSPEGPRVLGALGPGAFAGEFGLLTGLRTATLTARGATLLVEVQGSDLGESGSPAWRQVRTFLERRARDNMRQRVPEISALSPSERDRVEEATSFTMLRRGGEVDAKLAPAGSVLIVAAGVLERSVPEADGVARATGYALLRDAAAQGWHARSHVVLLTVDAEVAGSLLRSES